MENKKDIGRAISEKLSSLDKAPKEQLWNGISYELEKKKKRRIGFLLYWMKSIGFVLVAAMIGCYFYYQNGRFDSNTVYSSKDSIVIDHLNDETLKINTNLKNTIKDKTNNSITNNEKEIELENQNGNYIDKSNTTNDSLDNNISWKKVGRNHNKSNTLVNGNESSHNRKVVKISSKSSKNRSSSTYASKSVKGKLNSATESKNENSKRRIAKKESAEKSASSFSKTDNSKSIALNSDLSTLQDKVAVELNTQIKPEKKDTIAAKKGKVININMYPQDSLKKENEKMYRKFYVDAFISPTLYGYLVKDSSLDSRLDSQPKKTEIKCSYGFGLSYDLTERVSMRIGYRKLDLIFIIQNAPVNISDYRGITYDTNISNEAIYMISNFPEKMNIIQTISYSEIPLEVKYLILNQNLGIKSSFGFSYLMLDENKINIETLNGFEMKIGKTKNLSNTSVSINLGLEFDYPVFRNTKVFIQPMFNYQIMAFSDENYQPYILGIHAGLRYSLNNK